MYRLLDHFWHEAHAHRLNVLPVKRDYIWHDNWPKWDIKKRPFPPNDIIDHYTPGVYDAIICHVDEVCWRYPNMAPQFRELKQVVKEPIIVINHGTPDDATDAYMMRDWLEGCHMVVNSRQAARDWGWGTPIIHGYDESEWWCLLNPKPPEIITCIAGPSMFHDEYNGWDIMERLRFDYPITCIGLDEQPRTFDEYRNTLSRATIYLNTTRRSPMPGSRTEAMLMGLCIVSLNNHDIDQYIVDGTPRIADGPRVVATDQRGAPNMGDMAGVTGFLADDEDGLRRVLNYLTAYPKVAYEVGLAGAKAARQHFSIERYSRDWLTFLGQILQ